MDKRLETGDKQEDSENLGENLYPPRKVRYNGWEQLRRTVELFSHLILVAGRTSVSKHDITWLDMIGNVYVTRVMSLSQTPTPLRFPTPLGGGFWNRRLSPGTCRTENSPIGWLWTPLHCFPRFFFFARYATLMFVLRWLACLMRTWRCSLCL